MTHWRTPHSKLAITFERIDNVIHLPAGRGSTLPTGQLEESSVSYLSSELRETIAGGFVVAFSILVGALFGLILFFAQLIIEPGANSQLVEYQSHFQSNGKPR